MVGQNQKIGGLSRHLFSLALLGALVTGTSPAAAADFDANASWLYLAAWPDAGSTIPGYDRPAQRYALRLTHVLNDQLSVNGDFRSIIEGIQPLTGAQLEPNLGLTIDNDLFTSSVGYRRLERIDGSGRWVSRPRFYSSLTADLGWLPAMRVAYGWESSHDHDVVQTEAHQSSTLSLGLNKTFYQIETGYDFNYRESFNQVAEDRGVIERHLGWASYSETFLDDTLTISASQKASYSGTTVQLGLGGPAQLELHRATRALAGIDTTPLDDGTLTSTPALLDGNTNVPTNVNLTRDSDWNVALDLGSPRPVELIRVYVSTPFDPVLNPGFTWDVYTSDDIDGRFWTLHQTSAPFTYDDGFDRFELNINPTTERYIKVVQRTLAAATGTNVIVVTEIAALGGEIPPGTISERSTISHTTTASVLYQPLENLTVAYDFLYDRYGAKWSTARSHQLNHGATVNARASDTLGATLRFHHQEIQDDANYRQVGVLALTGDYAPLTTFNTQLAFKAGWGTRNGLDLATYSVLLRSFAQVYHGIEATVDMAVDQMSVATLGDQSNVSVKGTLNLRFNDALFALVEVNVRQRLSGMVGISTPTAGQNQIRGSLSYRPSAALYMHLLGEYVDAGAASGFSGTYSLNWQPSRVITVGAFARLRRQQVHQIFAGGSLSWRIGRVWSLFVRYQRSQPIEGPSFAGAHNLDVRLMATL